MILRIVISTLLLFVGFVRPGKTQTTVSDSQGVAVLTQALAASGAANALNPVQSFTAEGTMVYFWGGQEIQALSTIRARGHDQVRVDASVPGGMRSIVFNRNGGTRKDEEGGLTEIPLHNRVSMGDSPFPYLPIAAALRDPAVSISYLGLTESEGRSLHQVRARRTFTREQDPADLLSRLSETDFFVDTQTNLVVKVVDLTHPIETLTEDYLRETEFEGYAARGGVAVPTIVRQKIGGSIIWEFRLSTITFNTNLVDTDFTIQ